MADRMAESGLGLTIGTREQSRIKFQMNLAKLVTESYWRLWEQIHRLSCLNLLAEWSRATGRNGTDEFGDVLHFYLYL